MSQVAATVLEHMANDAGIGILGSGVQIQDKLVSKKFCDIYFCSICAHILSLFQPKKGYSPYHCYCHYHCCYHCYCHITIAANIAITHAVSITITATITIANTLSSQTWCRVLLESELNLILNKELLH